MKVLFNNLKEFEEARPGSLEHYFDLLTTIINLINRNIILLKKKLKPNEYTKIMSCSLDLIHIMPSVKTFGNFKLFKKSGRLGELSGITKDEFLDAIKKLKELYLGIIETNYPDNEHLVSQKNVNMDRLTELERIIKKSISDKQ